MPSEGAVGVPMEILDLKFAGISPLQPWALMLWRWSPIVQVA